MICPRQISLIAMVLVLLALRPAMAEPGPTELLKSSVKEAKTILEKKAAKGSKEDLKREDELRSLARRFLDYRELSQRALKEHWKGKSQGDQEQFVTLLQDLIETNYIKRIKSNPVFEIDYQAEEVKGDEATVRTLAKGEKAEAEINYSLIRKDSQWVVGDVVIDDVSMARTYRKQFTKIIQKDGWQALIEKMKKKLKEAKEE